MDIYRKKINNAISQSITTVLLPILPYLSGGRLPVESFLLGGTQRTLLTGLQLFQLDRHLSNDYIDLSIFCWASEFCCTMALGGNPLGEKTKR